MTEKLSVGGVFTGRLIGPQIVSAYNVFDLFLVDACMFMLLSQSYGVYTSSAIAA
ncbi:hypothetical protein FA10DRAFT_289525 [Acaromyces ingoldii]|uniref:Uncharacterized protein n=1 Tax=Acaromyces ingoldii TaxID=215250 RepID=A0A316YAK2_9BASI|nr:hypothetical protein FA10DRAFT_289525 [Acaromyces ingoldii]PWN86657.1 hypothetical protein FA10DRAFT_289525 [Acaromyces ingoldii]